MIGPIQTAAICRRCAPWHAISRAVQASVLLLAGVAVSTPAMAQSQGDEPTRTRLQAGSLDCESREGWGAIFISRKSFTCVFTPVNDKTPAETYEAVVRKYGLDLGPTTQSALSWIVLGPGTRIAGGYAPGSLEGEYAGVGAQASVGVGLGVNALVGGGPESFALQPVSIQVERGYNIAAGVQTLELTYRGPAGFDDGTAADAPIDLVPEGAEDAQ